MSTIILNSPTLSMLELEAQRVRVQLQKIVENIDNELLNALLEAAHFMVTMAKSYVRVDTGSLQRSIRVERTAPLTHHHISVRVRAGGYVVNPKTMRLVDYAGHQEKYHPYMRPAWEATKRFVEAQVDAALARLAT